MFESPGSTAIAGTRNDWPKGGVRFVPSHAAIGGAHDIDRLRADRIGYPRPKDGGIRWVERDVEDLVVKSDTEVSGAQVRPPSRTFPDAVMVPIYALPPAANSMSNTLFPAKAGTSDHVLPPSAER